MWLHAVINPINVLAAAKSFSPTVIPLIMGDLGITQPRCWWHNHGLAGSAERIKGILGWGETTGGCPVVVLLQ